MSQYYVVACFLHWPETLGQRAITRHSQTGYIVTKLMRNDASRESQSMADLVQVITQLTNQGFFAA